MSRADQIPRQWRILRRLEAHRYGLSAADLASEEDCPIRTIYRDLADLEEAGFPLIQERRGKRSLWKLAFNRNGPQVPFELSELSALWIGRGFMELLKGTVFYEGVFSALEKVKATLPPGVLEHLEESKISVRQNQTQKTELFSDFLPIINEALEGCFRLQITYFTPESNKNTERKVDPYRLWIQDGVMYLIGYCHLREGLRTFKLARIREISKIEEEFEPDPDFDIDTYLAGSFRVMTGERMEVEILFDPLVRHIAEENVWHETQTITECDDGSVILSFHASGLQEIKTWVLGFGSKVCVLQPASLRQAVAEDLLKSCQRYQTP